MMFYLINISVFVVMFLMLYMVWHQAKMVLSPAEFKIFSRQGTTVAVSSAIMWGCNIVLLLILSVTIDYFPLLILPQAMVLFGGLLALDKLLVFLINSVESDET